MSQPKGCRLVPTTNWKGFKDCKIFKIDEWDFRLERPCEFLHNWIILKLRHVPAELSTSTCSNDASLRHLAKEAARIISSQEHVRLLPLLLATLCLLNGPTSDWNHFIIIISNYNLTHTPSVLLSAAQASDGWRRSPTIHPDRTMQLTNTHTHGAAGRFIGKVFNSQRALNTCRVCESVWECVRVHRVRPNDCSLDANEPSEGYLTS